ncbi:T9SS type A sorting domain-containing protein [Melioribacteraceae bacterium 4301-Me]|uniref:T9SS type A sorting domain-containing protein n=1 Tax=Pyranulibacter aquaticus TaxID=3163344 RepID=UPI00359B532B
MSIVRSIILVCIKIIQIHLILLQKIRFTLPEADFVTLKVYDILGREVKELINEVKPSGEYEVEFNGSNLPSGTYIYKLTTGKYSAVGKMTLMK